MFSVRVECTYSRGHCSKFHCQFGELAKLCCKQNGSRKIYLMGQRQYDFSRHTLVLRADLLQCFDREGMFRGAGTRAKNRLVT